MIVEVPFRYQVEAIVRGGTAAKIFLVQEIACVEVAEREPRSMLRAGAARVGGWVTEDGRRDLTPPMQEIMFVDGSCMLPVAGPLVADMATAAEKRDRALYSRKLVSKCRPWEAVRGKIKEVLAEDRDARLSAAQDLASRYRVVDGIVLRAGPEPVLTFGRRWSTDALSVSVTTDWGRGEVNAWRLDQFAEMRDAMGAQEDMRPGFLERLETLRPEVARRDVWRFDPARAAFMDAVERLLPTAYGFLKDMPREAAMDVLELRDLWRAAADEPYAPISERFANVARRVLEFDARVLDAAAFPPARNRCRRALEALNSGASVPERRADFDLPQVRV